MLDYLSIFTRRQTCAFFNNSINDDDRRIYHSIIFLIKRIISSTNLPSDVDNWKAVAKTNWQKIKEIDRIPEDKLKYKIRRKLSTTPSYAKILVCIGANEPISRVELEKEVGLSWSQINRIVNWYTWRGVVRYTNIYNLPENLRPKASVELGKILHNLEMKKGRSGKNIIRNIQKNMVFCYLSDNGKEFLDWAYKVLGLSVDEIEVIR
jgi:hypothetical protein